MRRTMYDAAGNRMKSFGFLSPLVIFSSSRAAFCSCACHVDGAVEVTRGVDVLMR